MPGDILFARLLSLALSYQPRDELGVHPVFERQLSNPTMENLLSWLQITSSRLLRCHQCIGLFRGLTNP